MERLYEEAQRYQLGAGRPVDVRKAVQLYQKVIGKDPQHADARYNLAGLCFKQMRYDLAGKYYQEVVKLRPTDGHAYNNLGTVYEKQGRAKEAGRYYQQALRVDPDVAMAYYNLSRLLFAEGDLDKALVLLEKALRLEPDNPVFVNQKARIEGEMGKISTTTIGLVVGLFAGVLIVYSIVMRKKRGV